MAILMRVNGSLDYIYPVNGRGRAFTLSELQGIVGGLTEVVRCGSLRLVIDEEGKLKGKERNEGATLYALPYLGAGDYVVGDAVLCSPAGVGEEREDDPCGDRECGDCDIAGCDGPPEVSEEDYRMATDQYLGWCQDCAEFRVDGMEPDARGYECPACGGTRTVGAEDALMDGLFRFKEVEIRRVEG
jgi:hypothetical protein